MIIIQRWKGADYEDVMRHQTYELNMGRPFSEIQGSIREQYDSQVGHNAYRSRSAEWIGGIWRARGPVFSPSNWSEHESAKPIVITLSFLESIIKLAFHQDPYLATKYPALQVDQSEVKQVGKYLFDFYEGVRLSMV